MSFFSPSKQDVIDIEILPDGTIRSTTPKISAGNHSSANAFFRLLSRLTGGTTEVKRRESTAAHHQTEHIKGDN